MQVISPHLLPIEPAMSTEIQDLEAPLPACQDCENLSKAPLDMSFDGDAPQVPLRNESNMPPKDEDRADVCMDTNKQHDLQCEPRPGTLHKYSVAEFMAQVTVCSSGTCHAAVSLIKG